jgi:GNAT superfamily N-acetyltransferase
VKNPGKVQATEATLLATLGFDPPGSPAHAKTLLVFPEDSDATTPPAGMAVYFNNYSTWLARPGIRLEDLYVRPEFRGRGYGSQLLAALAKEVLDIGGGRLEWGVLKCWCLCL